MTLLSLEPSILFHHITWACNLCDCDNAVTVTCDITFCLLCLYPNKEKETQNKIKENKKKGKLNKTKSIVHNSDTTRKSLSSENPKSIILLHTIFKKIKWNFL